MNQRFRPVLGPYDCYTLQGPEPVTVASLDFSEVAGGQVCMQVIDNLGGGGGTSAQSQVNTNNLFACAIVEVSIVGSIYGIQTTLKQVAMRGITGPVVYRFDTGDAFQNILFKARMLRGGQQLINATAIPYFDTTDDNAATAFSAARGFTAELTITVQPQLIFPEKPKGGCQ
jgi:hypothetical protein